MIKIGHAIQDFSCDAVVNNAIKKVSLSDFSDQYKLIFFYPLNFTFVCPTELHALQDSLDEFAKRGTQVLAISVDSPFSHLAWLSTPRVQGGIQGVAFPLLSDLKKTLSAEFGVLKDDAGVALRGVFLLDKNNVLQYAAVHNLSLGRSTQELLRLVDALHHVETHGEVCPANWSAGQKAMTATQTGLKDYFKETTV